MNLSYPLAEKGVITSKYGYRNHPIKNRQIHHNGIDIGIPVGTSVKSIDDGEVVRSDMSDKNGYGNFICVKHNDLNGGTKFSCYAHLLKRLKSVGDTVLKGEEIGKSGGRKGDPGAGSSTGPHLHFEIRNKLSGDWNNPDQYLRGGTTDIVPNKKPSTDPKNLFANSKNIFAKYAKEYDTATPEQQAMMEEIDRMKDIMKKIL